MRKFKITASIIAAILAIALPFITLGAVAIACPAQYGETFVGALDGKISRLESIEEDKIVVVGGSSVAFGLNSRELEGYTGMPSVNFGLYAALGTKLMLDLSLPHIEEGDVVVIAPELDAQTLSLYFSASTTLRALDGNLSYLFDLPSEHYSSLLGQSFDFAFEKLEYMLSDKPDPTGVYNSKSFDEYGDMIYPREENKMPLSYNPNELINLTENILDSEFVTYLNNYVLECRERGAKVFFSYPPMNELAFESETYLEDARAFEEYLDQKLNCGIISDITDYILPGGYFYDTNFHLNDTGAALRTVLLARDLAKALNLDTSKIPEELPTLPGEDVEPEEPDQPSEPGEPTEPSEPSEPDKPSEPECFHEDYDEDGLCDWCEVCIEHADKNKDHKCDRCKEPYTAPCTRHTDNDKNHKCDYCEKDYTAPCKIHTFENNGELCDYCGIEKPYDENEKYFNFTVGKDGSATLISVKDEYKNMTSLTVPLYYDGAAVLQIGASAFSGTSLRELTVTEDTNLAIFRDGAFWGASNLESLIMLYPNAENILPPSSFAGVASGFTVYITDEGNYRDDYYWCQRGLTFEYLE